MRSVRRTTAIPWFLGVCAGLLLVVVGIQLGWRKSSDSTPKIDRSAVNLRTSIRDDLQPFTELPATEFANTSPEVKYIGSQICGDCHAEQSAGYIQTHHSRAFREIVEADEPPDGSFPHPASGRIYKVYRREGQLWHCESLRMADGAEVILAEYPMKYVVGSGQLARTYLLEDDGFLAESPVSWYASLQAWQLSPGFDHSQPFGFQRPVDERCLFCHVGRVTRPESELASVQIHEQAISCERCHGPGALHTKRWEHGESGQGKADYTIVHPARLGREEQESICAQCHLESAAFVDVRGRQWGQFRPGYSLRQFVAHYRLESASDHQKVVGHVEQLRQSRCYQKSASLTCTTCHKPHQAPMTPNQSLAFHRGQCLACHSKTADQKLCRLNQDERLRQDRDDNCVKCHMPRSPTETPHVASTHHRIGLHERTTSPDQVLTEAVHLVPVDDMSFLSPADRERSLGLANLVFAESEDGRRFRTIYLQRARTLLEPVQVAGLFDATVHAALAQLQYENGEFLAASRSVQLALNDENGLTPAVRISTERSLAQLLFQRHDHRSAQRILEQVVRERRVADDWELLGACRQEMGDFSGALAAIERAVQINPDNPVLVRVLVELSRLTNDADRIQRYRQRGRLLDPSRRVPQPQQ